MGVLVATSQGYVVIDLIRYEGVEGIGRCRRRGVFLQTRVGHHELDGERAERVRIEADQPLRYGYG